MATTSTIQTALWANVPGATVSVPTTAGGTAVLSVNLQRQACWISNPSASGGATIWLSLGGTPAVGSGIPVFPQTTWFTKQFSGAINGISSSGTVTVAVSEI